MHRDTGFGWSNVGSHVFLLQFFFKVYIFKQAFWKLYLNTFSNCLFVLGPHSFQKWLKTERSHVNNSTSGFSFETRRFRNKGLSIPKTSTRRRVAATHLRQTALLLPQSPPLLIFCLHWGQLSYHLSSYLYCYFSY